MERLESFGHLREVDSEKSRVKAVISTGDIARDDAIIDPEGWDFSNYDRNPVVLWMHNDGAMPFARTVDRIAGANELIATAEFDMEDPMGATVFRKIAAGFVNATSVRWLPKRTELITEGKGKGERQVLIFREQELLEWSFVTIPADPKALIMRAEGGEFSARDYITERIAEAFARDSDPIPVETLPPAPAALNGHSPDYSRLELLLEKYLERRGERQDVDEMIITALSRATGKSVERIRHELAEGGFRYGLPLGS